MGNINFIRDVYGKENICSDTTDVFSKSMTVGEK